MEKRDHRLDLLKNRGIIDNGYQLYNKENGDNLVPNRYLGAEKPHLTKLTGDLEEDFSRALTRARMQTNIAGLEPLKYKNHVPYLRVRNFNQDVKTTKNIAGLR